MSFLKTNWIVLLLVFTTLMSEVFHLLFINVPFNDFFNLDTPMYYLVAQIGLLNFIPAIAVFLLIPKSNKSSRGIAFGLVLYNILEVADEIFYMMKISNGVFELGKSFWEQIFLFITIIVLSYFGYTKLKS